HSLVSAAQRHEQARTRIEHAIRDALSARDARLLTALGVLSHLARATGPGSSWARRLLAATILNLRAEERSAATVLSSQYLSGMIPDLPSLDSKVVKDSNLAQYLRVHLPAGELSELDPIRCFLKALERHPVHQVRVEGIVIPVVE